MRWPGLRLLLGLDEERRLPLVLEAARTASDGMASDGMASDGTPSDAAELLAPSGAAR